MLYFQLHLSAYALYPHNFAKVEIFRFTVYEQNFFCMQYLPVCLFHYCVSNSCKVITRIQTLTKNPDQEFQLKLNWI